MYKEELISVVIPVYNVESYLEQCLESVCDQSYENIEIILINDGSTDRSEEICENWQCKDKRIRYFKQKNCGIGPTRNRGIELSLGKYITFIDSDDWIDQDCIKRLYEKLIKENADICTGDFMLYNDKNRSFELSFSIIENDAYVNAEMYSPHIWGRLYNKNIFTQYNIKMPKLPYEDLAVFPLMAVLSKKITYVDSPVYYYRVNTGKSIMDNLDNVRRYPEVLEYLVKGFKKFGLFHEYAKVLLEITLINMRAGLKRARIGYSIEQYNQLSDEFEEFLDKYFYEWRNIFNLKVWVLGSYNLSRLADYMMFDYDICKENTKYYGFSSIISLMSNKCSLNGDHRNPFRLNMLKRDLNKSFMDSDVKRDDYILIDFLEERYDILKIGDSYITKSEVLEESTCDINKARVINRYSIECDKLWKDSCLKFIDFLNNKFERDKIILVEMYLCEKYIYKNKIYDFNDDNISKMNKVLFEYYSFFKKNLPGIKVIQVPEKINYINDNFKYGCKPYYVNSVALHVMSQNIRNEIRK